MTTDFVFAYGSNMNRSDLRSWIESDGYDSSLLQGATPAVLEGYDFVWNFYSEGKNGGKANIEPREHSAIYGILIEIDNSLLKAFDRKEGHPYFHSRGENRIPVRRMSDGATVMAWVYIAKANKGDRRDIWPTRAYRKTVLEAAIYWEFPEEYIEKIKNWPSA